MVKRGFKEHPQHLVGYQDFFNLLYQKAIKAMVYGLDSLAVRRHLAQWSRVYFPNDHEGPDEHMSLHLLRYAGGWNSILNLAVFNWL